MSSEIVFLITEQRNKQRITLPSGRGSYRFGRSAQCEYVLRRNNVGISSLPLPVPMAAGPLPTSPTTAIPGTTTAIWQQGKSARCRWGMSSG